MQPIWTRSGVGQGNGTHQYADQRGAHGCVLGKADVVHGPAEDGPVVVLIDEVDEDPREAHMVRHGLVGVELSKRERERERGESGPDTSFMKYPCSRVSCHNAPSLGLLQRHKQVVD